jgi:hypothetical protein
MPAREAEAWLLMCLTYNGTIALTRINLFVPVLNSYGSKQIRKVIISLSEADKQKFTALTYRGLDSNEEFRIVRNTFYH